MYRKLNNHKEREKEKDQWFVRTTAETTRQKRKDGKQKTSRRGGEFGWSVTWVVYNHVIYRPQKKTRKTPERNEERRKQTRGSFGMEGRRREKKDNEMHTIRFLSFVRRPRF